MWLWGMLTNYLYGCDGGRIHDYVWMVDKMMWNDKTNRLENFVREKTMPTKAGLYWARRIVGDPVKFYTRWVIIEVSGVFPFLKATIALSLSDHDIKNDPENFDLWEYGPEIISPGKDVQRENE